MARKSKAQTPSMDERYNRTFDGLLEYMQANPREVLKEREAMQRKLIKRRFAHGDGVMQTTLSPVFLRPESLSLLQYTSEVLDGVLEKAMSLYFESPRVRAAFPLHFEVPRAWIEQPTGFSRIGLINRHDVLFDGKTLKYIEFNTDNPGGKGWTDLLGQVFREVPLFGDLIDLSEAEDRPILSGLFDTMMEAYAQWGQGDKPRLSVLGMQDWHRGDGEIVRDYFVERGVEANLHDVRNLTYRDGRLHSDGVQFDLIMRAVKARFYLMWPQAMGDFHAAMADNAACMVNSWRCLLGAEKALMSFITNPLNHDLFEEEEVRVIKAHVPWTRTFAEGDTISPEGEEVSLKAFMLGNRERLVIKPSAGAGGYGVKVGRSTDAEEWRQLVEEYEGWPDWVVQDFVPIPELELPVIRGGKIVVEPRFLNLSPYVFGGKYAGCLGRVSSQDVINVGAGGGMIPVFRLKDDSKGMETLGGGRPATAGGKVEPPSKDSKA